MYNVDFKNQSSQKFTSKKELLDFCHKHLLTPTRVVYFKSQKSEVGVRVCLLKAKNQFGWKLDKI